MARLAFRMKLHPGMEDEYRRRHDALWPELEQLLRDTGISDYSIFLDPETLFLFGVLEVTDPLRMDDLPSHPVMKKWWAFMKDIMDSHPDHSPVSVPLVKVFRLE
ncbi:MAG: L-rhamnose mutarotase [Bacteroidota bacterium]